MSFEEINNALNALNAPSNIRVSIVSLAGVTPKECAAGTTIASFKAANGLAGMKIVNNQGRIMGDTDVLTDGLELYISTPKQNG